MSQPGIPGNTHTACVICQRWERTPFYLRHTTPTSVLDTETAMVVGFWISSRMPKDLAARLCERHSTYLFQLDESEEARLLQEKANQEAANPQALEFQRRAHEISQRLSGPNPVVIGPAAGGSGAGSIGGQAPPLTLGMLGTPIPVRQAAPPAPVQPGATAAQPAGFRNPILGPMPGLASGPGPGPVAGSGSAGIPLAGLQPARVAPGATQAVTPAPAPPGPVAATPAPVAAPAEQTTAQVVVSAVVEQAQQAYVQPPTPGQQAGTEPGTFVVPLAGVAPPDADTRPKFPCPLGCGRLMYSGQVHDCDRPDAGT